MYSFQRITRKLVFITQEQILSAHEQIRLAQEETLLPQGEILLAQKEILLAQEEIFITSSQEEPLILGGGLIPRGMGQWKLKLILEFFLFGVSFCCWGLIFVIWRILVVKNEFLRSWASFWYGQNIISYLVCVVLANKVFILTHCYNIFFWQAF